VPPPNPASYTHLSVSIATAGTDRLFCRGGRPACRSWRHLAAGSNARVSTGLANNSTFPGRGAFFRRAGRPALRQAGCPPLPQAAYKVQAQPQPSHSPNQGGWVAVTVSLRSGLRGRPAGNLIPPGHFCGLSVISTTSFSRRSNGCANFPSRPIFTVRISAGAPLFADLIWATWALVSCAGAPRSR